MREPFGTGDDAIEPVAMQHQKALAIGGFVNGLAGDFDTREQPSHIIAGEFVMIAGHEDYASAAIDLCQDFGHDAILRLVPVPAALELPTIDDVAHQKESAAFIVRQEIGKRFRLAAACAQMSVGNEDGAVAVSRSDRRAFSQTSGGKAVSCTLEPDAARCGRLQKG